jgi:cyclopropane fatty-acyl-phospholipid synthase-like methyltransferase
MWEDRYNRPDYLFGTRPAQFLTRRAEWFAPGTSLLSVAEGEGRNAVWLAQRGVQVTGIEYAPSAIAKANKLAAEASVAPTFLQADLFDWDWPEAAFDIVLGVFIQFVGADARADLFARMQRAVKPGGLVLLHGYTPKQLDYGTGGPKALENLYTEALLREAFDGWTLELCESYEAHLDEGDGHSGQSALIDFIARKPA